MKKIVFLFPLLLAGCATTQDSFLVSKQQVAVVPPPEMYNCPQVHLPTSTANLTDTGVAKIIAMQHQNLKVCRNSLNAIKQFTEDAQKQIEK